MVPRSLLVHVVCFLLFPTTAAKSTWSYVHLEKRGSVILRNEQLVSSPVAQVNGGFSVTREADRAHTNACSDLQGDTLSTYGAVPNINCKWTLSTNNKNQVFKITIEQLDIGNPDHCKKEHLRFTDSLGESIDLCGVVTPADHCVYTTLGNKVVAEFVTDADPALESFRITLAAVDAGSTSRTCERLFGTSVLRELADVLYGKGRCGSAMTSDYGSIMSPNYPADYPSFQDCEWTITTNPGKKVAIHMDEMHIENSGWSCTYDYLRLIGLTGSPYENINFCGNMFNIELQSDSNSVRIIFHSDDSETRKGFNLYYYPADTIQNPNLGCGMFPGGSFPSRIYGGEEAVANSWPHIVGLYQAGQHFCGGTILTPKWILTAAHCFYPLGTMQGSALLVTAGDHTISAYEYTEQTVRIANVISHRYYDDDSKNHDIALLELAMPLAYTADVKPICAASRTPADGTKCIAAGWGNTEGPSKDKLREVGLPLMPTSTCNQMFQYDAVTAGMLCAGQTAGGIDTCQGDSGGPLMCHDGIKWCLVGVTSWGNGCGNPNSPGVYAKVSYYKEWIKTNSKHEITNAHFCS